eukprot:scaffold213_cov245-Pinguiococcus_pyrenoidosus.AAC.23
MLHTKSALAVSTRKSATASSGRWDLLYLRETGNQEGRVRGEEAEIRLGEGRFRTRAVGRTWSDAFLGRGTAAVARHQQKGRVAARGLVILLLQSIPRQEPEVLTSLLHYRLGEKEPESVASLVSRSRLPGTANLCEHHASKIGAEKEGRTASIASIRKCGRHEMGQPKKELGQIVHAHGRILRRQEIAVLPTAHIGARGCEAAIGKLDIRPGARTHRELGIQAREPTDQTQGRDGDAEVLDPGALCKRFIQTGDDPRQGIGPWRRRRDAPGVTGLLAAVLHFSAGSRLRHLPVRGPQGRVVVPLRRRGLRQGLHQLAGQVQGARQLAHSLQRGVVREASVEEIGFQDGLPRRRAAHSSDGLRLVAKSQRHGVEDVR